MNLEHVWCLRCTEAPDIAYALPISRKLKTASHRKFLESKVSNPDHVIYGYETLFVLRENLWSVTPLKQGKGIFINGQEIKGGHTTPLLEGDIMEFRSGPMLVGEKGKESCKFRVCKSIVFSQTNCNESKADETVIEENDNKENQVHQFQNAKKQSTFASQPRQWTNQLDLSTSEPENQRRLQERKEPLNPKVSDSDKLAGTAYDHSLKLTKKASSEIMARNFKSDPTRRNPSNLCNYTRQLKSTHNILECRVILHDIRPLLGKRRKISVNLLRQKMKVNHRWNHEKKRLFCSRKASMFSSRVKCL